MKTIWLYFGRPAVATLASVLAFQLWFYSVRLADDALRTHTLTVLSGFVVFAVLVWLAMKLFTEFFGQAMHADPEHAFAAHFGTPIRGNCAHIRTFDGTEHVYVGRTMVPGSLVPAVEALRDELDALSRAGY